MRMFVALVPPESALDDLDRFLAVRREAGDFRWTPVEHFHVTLAFCDHVPDRSLDDFVERLTRAGRKRRQVTTSIRGGGAFPDVARARVLWAGLGLSEADAEEVRRMAVGARAAAAKAGIEVDGQRFRPHLTVARTGRPSEVSNWVRLLDAYAGPTWTTDRLSLIASHLGEGPRRRPRYELVSEFAVGKESRADRV